MGDPRAPGPGRDAAKSTSSRPLTSTHPSSRESTAPAVDARPDNRSSATSSSVPPAKVPSTSPPTTEDIDSEWETSAEPFESPASATAELDSAASNEALGSALADEPRVHAESSTPTSLAPSADEQPTNSRAQVEERTLEPATVAPLATAPGVTTDVAEPPAPSRAVEQGSKPKAAPRSVSRRKVVLVAGAAAAVLVGLWFARGGGSSSVGEPGVQALRPETAHVEASKIEAASPASPAGVTPAAPSAAEPEAVVPAGASAEAPATPVPAASVPGKVVVVVSVRPPNARIYHRGKEAGKAPLRVELEPGQKRAFEVGAPGFMTRKVVVDGSLPEVLVGLRASSPYAIGASTPTPAK